ncbi:hypothetical protein Fmac_010151 [Flemingia macrophylla]|uniref:Uncharacterized protein n=1 Tax=Flemingia macrophylla TaxID=520843 RepID=A0ABD1N2V7_9FABA
MEHSNIPGISQHQYGFSYNEKMKLPKGSYPLQTLTRGVDPIIITWSREPCSSLISQLGYVKAYSETCSVYNLLKYSKRTMCKALHEKILHILIAGQLLKDAYAVVKRFWEEEEEVEMCTRSLKNSPKLWIQIVLNLPKRSSNAMAHITSTSDSLIIPTAYGEF